MVNDTSDTITITLEKDPNTTISEFRGVKYRVLTRDTGDHLTPDTDPKQYVATMPYMVQLKRWGLKWETVLQCQDPKKAEDWVRRVTDTDDLPDGWMIKE